ncbi:NAD(P)H-dependent oxidoreductase [Secundilactobacillus oryzae]|uniref:NAD(P)H-dependent oxidoreductase n=1 Tax=Secundilactobacillus oryzae TaxID=1202668 RepID=UPI000ACB77A3
MAVNQPIDVEIEQRLLAENDRIIFQFPLYWYSSPASLKTGRTRFYQVTSI